MPPRILTFNWHESYIHLLAKTRCAFDVVEVQKAGIYGWIHAIRPVPPNCRLIPEPVARRNLQSGEYDSIIAHNLSDLLFVREWEQPKVLVFHNKLSTEIALSQQPVDRSAYLARVAWILAEAKNLKLVFISKAKQLDWGFEGEIILPAVDPEDYGGYRGEEARVLRVGNGLKERNIMLGYTLQEGVTRGLPSTILGLNPLIPEARVPSGWDEYRECLRRHRVYLNTTVEPYEDGYNLAMLEAMATGMPVVSSANSSSPIEDGVNGYVSDDQAELTERLASLLTQRSLAVSLGRRARETVFQRFPLQEFVDRWRGVLDSSRPRRTVGAKRSDPRRLKVLMSYTANPQTTAAYLEKALRRHCDVITYGPCIRDDILRLWNMEALKPRVREHDIAYYTKDMTEVFRRLARSWRPDLCLWVETGINYPMEGVESLPCLTACYLIDSHLNFDSHLEIARRFHCVFVAQKAYVPRYKEAGLEHVYWLPLACDPDVHRKFEGDKSFDVSFVGSVTQLNRERNALLVRLAERFPLHVDRCFLEEMARTFSRSKIVFNSSIQNDLNMRVFEAMATGSLLVTDEAPGSGLTDLLEDGKHLVLYRNEPELYERVAHYLRNDAAREQIAAAGRQEVLGKHTYEHRAREMMEAVMPLLARSGLAGRVTRDIAVCNPVKACPPFARHAAAEGNKTMAFQKETVEISAPLRDYYKKERCDLAALVPEGAEKILDIGCGGGHLGKLLKERSGQREIWGVERHPEAFEEARRWLDQVFLADVCQWEPPVGKGYFDVLVLADVLEHLLDPKAVLERYLAWLKPAGSVVMSIPNVRFWGVVKHLVDGYWTYQDEGLLDRDHVRFFTWTEIERLLGSCGLEVAEVRWNMDKRCPHVPEGKTIDLQLGRVTVHGLEADEVRDFFVFQYLVRGARSRERLLTDARQLEASGRNQEAFRLYASLAGRDEVEPGVVRKLTELWTTPEERQRASSMLEECLHLHPANPELLVTSARMLAEERQMDAARHRLERVLLFLPEHVEARRLLDALPKVHSIP